MQTFIRIRWGNAGRMGQGEREKESHLLAPGYAVRQLSAVLEVPRNKEQSQAGPKASAFSNPLSLLK